MTALGPELWTQATTASIRRPLHTFSGCSTAVGPRYGSPSMRWTVRLASLATALALLTAACGGGGDGTDQGDPGRTTTSDPTGTDLGDRIVVIGEEDLLADVLALGVTPIASTATVHERGFQGLDDFDTGGIEVLPTTTLSLDALAALDPSTIVTLQFWVDQVDRSLLEGMADHLVVLPDGLASEQQITTLGRVLDRQDQAESIVADLRSAEEAARAAVPDGCAVSVAAIYPGPSPAVFVEGPWVVPASFLDVGCRLVPEASEVEPDANGRVYLSMEELGLMAGPVLVLMQTPSVEGDTGALEQVQGNRLWSTLPAVADDAVVVVDRLGHPGATGHIRFLEEIPSIVAR